MDSYDDIDIKSRRDRIDIAISCISTIFLCTWVAFHPNIPGPEEPKWKVIRRRIGCMIGGILAPEIYVLLAARQFIAARAFAKTYRDEGWRLTHGFFALMGGFMIYDDKTSSKIAFFDPDSECLSLHDAFGRNLTSLKGFEYRLASQHLPLDSPKRSSPTQRSGHFAHSLDALEFIRSHSSRFEVPSQRVRKEFKLYIDDCIPALEYFDRISAQGSLSYMRSEYERYKMDHNLFPSILSFLEAYECYTTTAALGDGVNTEPATTIDNDATEPIPVHISIPPIDNQRLRNTVPRLNEQDIQDKSKSDILTKTIALFQVTWFILQLCARYHENLAITELEIFTLAFCVLNFATYALWWKKPFAVDRGYAIRWRDSDWEVTAPPFVKTDEVPWYQYCWMRGDTKGYNGIEETRLEPHDDSSLPTSSTETTSSSSRQFQPLLYLWKKVKHSLSSLWAGIDYVVNVVFYRLTRGETTLLDSGKRVSTFSPTMMRLEGSKAFIYYLSGCFLILVFGSIHFLAWSSGPTNTDKLIWRICSICVAVLPVIVFLSERYGDLLASFDNEVVKTIAFISLLIFLTTPLFYILARIGLLVVVVRSLIYCPPSALQAVSWSQLIPHV